MHKEYKEAINKRGHLKGQNTQKIFGFTRN